MKLADRVSAVTDIKAVALRAPRRVAVGTALVIIGIGAVMAVRSLFLWRNAAESGGTFDDGILGPLLSVVPEGTRPIASLAVWLLVILTTVPMLARNSVLVGAVAARVEADHLLLWVPLSLRSRPSNGFRIERGETVVVTHRASKRGLFNQNEKQSMKFTAGTRSLFAELDAKPAEYSIAGLVASAKLAEVQLEFRDTAKEFDDSPR